VGDDTTNFEIDDPGGGVRIAGIAGSPGAAASSVLTADGDGGTSWEAGGGQAVNASLRVQDVAVTTDGANFIGSLTGHIYVAANSIAFAAVMGAVCDLDRIRYLLNGEVPETADNFDIQLSVTVTDITGANQASATGGFAVPSPVTSLLSANSLAGGTWSVDAGTDLTVNGNILSSTAGGTFFVFVQAVGSWD
jgi:hypothetical protein